MGSTPSSSSSRASSSVASSSYPSGVKISSTAKRFDTQKTLVWTFYDELGKHTVILEHDLLLGRRLLKSDGVQIAFQDRKILDSGDIYDFVINSSSAMYRKACQVEIREIVVNFGYRMLVDKRLLSEYHRHFWSRCLYYQIPLTTNNIHSTSSSSSSSFSQCGPHPDKTSPPLSASSSYAHLHIITSPQLVVLINDIPTELNSQFSTDEHDNDPTLTTHQFSFKQGNDESIHFELLSKTIPPPPSLSSSLSSSSDKPTYQFELTMNGKPVIPSPLPFEFSPDTQFPIRPPHPSDAAHPYQMIASSAVDWKEYASRLNNHGAISQAMDTLA